MKTLTTLFALVILSATASAQTIKALGYETINNTVVGLTAGQRIEFQRLGVVSGTESVPSIAFATGTNAFGLFSGTAFGIGPLLGFSVDGTRRFFISTNTIRAELPISFSAGNDSATRTNLGLGATWLTNDNVTNFRAAIGLGATNDVTFGGIQAGAIGVFSNVVEFFGPIFFDDRAGSNNVFQFEIPGDEAIARTNLGIPLPALTNTNNADTMRALAGSTNAGEPYSGSLELVNAADDVFVVQISNGIILSVEEQ